MRTKVSRIFFLTGILICGIHSLAQTNLVYDPSMEDTLYCPGHPTDLASVRYWYQPVQGNNGSTDYLNICHNFFHINLSLGIIPPRTGNAYFHIQTGMGFLSYREYLCGMLQKPLMAGHCYNVQFYVTPKKRDSVPAAGVNRVGIWFSPDSILTSVGHMGPIYVEAYVEHHGGPICDTGQYTAVRGTFVAKGGERHFIIGNFNDNQHTVVETCYDPGKPIASSPSVFIDDVSVWPCNTPVYEADGGIDQHICQGENIILGNNPADSEYQFLWSTQSHKLVSADLWDTLSTRPYLLVNPTFTTTYYLRLKDFKMDVSYDSVTVFVDPCLPLPIIPNVFTPNGDGVNDRFAFENHEGWELSTCIRNRWGKVVFEGEDNQWWDGQIHGQNAAEGVYYYTVTARNHYGQHEILSGIVTLMR